MAPHSGPVGRVRWLGDPERPYIASEYDLALGVTGVAFDPLKRVDFRKQALRQDLSVFLRKERRKPGAKSVRPVANSVAVGPSSVPA